MNKEHIGLNNSAIRSRIASGIRRTLLGVSTSIPTKEVVDVKRYLTTSFNPLMLAGGAHAKIRECRLRDAKQAVERDGAKSIVRGDLAAEVVSKLMDIEVEPSRDPVMLRPGDELFCVVPGYQPKEGEEITEEDVNEAGCRAFKVVTERGAITINEQE